MEPVLLASRLILAAALLAAAGAKLADCTGTSQAMLGFGIPRRFASLSAVLLPFVEVGIAAALLSAAHAWAAAIAALGLLALFVAAIGVNLARGRAPACGCFGRASMSPLGIAALLRTELLAAVAVLVVWQGRTSAGADVFEWACRLTLGKRLLSIVILCAVVLGAEWVPTVYRFLSAARQLVAQGAVNRFRMSPSAAETRNAVDGFPQSGVPIGAPAPTFDLEPAIGGRLSLELLHQEGLPALILFSDASCVPCRALSPMIARWRFEYSGLFAIAVIDVGDHGAEGRLSGRRVAEAYRVPAVPSGVFVRADGRIGSRLAVSAPAVESLVRTWNVRSSAAHIAHERGAATSGGVSRPVGMGVHV